MLLVGLHLFIFKHNGSAGPASDALPKTYGRFYPNQIFMESITAFIVVAIIVALAIVMPTPLLAKADPNNAQFIPAPAWYFYALYGLLRMFPQNLSLVPTVILPGAFTMVLLLLPWLDRNPSRVIARRPYLVVFTILTVGAIVGTTVYSAKVIAAGTSGEPGRPNASRRIRCCTERRHAKRNTDHQCGRGRTGSCSRYDRSGCRRLRAIRYMLRTARAAIRRKAKDFPAHFHPSPVIRT